jgi:hypothetical protein
MKIFEVADVSKSKLMALTQFLSGRAADTSAKKQISTDAFIKLAQSLGVNLTVETLGEFTAQEPLNNVLEPFEPNSGVVRFKGNQETSNSMPVDKAEEVVDRNAKAALNRRK